MNPFFIGIPGALIAFLLAYVFGVAPFVFISLILCSAWYFWNAWRTVKALQTPLLHRRLFGASLGAGMLAIVFFCGACAATSLMPHEEGRMDVDRFWKIIDDVHERAGDDNEARVALLKAELEALELEEIAAFQRHYDAQTGRTYRWDLWGAAYVINGGCSDDCFDYFRDWLISEGRSTFEAALVSPDSLANLPRTREAENELFGYAALKAYREKSGHEMEFDPVEIRGAPKGQEWREEDLPKLFPRLSEKYGG